MQRAEPLFLRSDALPRHGETIGDSLVVQRTLGVGGMGGVLLAHDVALDREVAVKMVLPELLHAPGARERFVREARAMAAVHHQNVVPIYDFGEHRGMPYLVMEYVPGSTLAARILDADGGVAADEALGVLELVCSGLDAIHRCGVVHGDIKPSNILLGPSFRVYLSDFGVAQVGGTQEGAVIGSPWYLAPERFDEQPLDARLGPRSDLYALGIVAYELLTGAVPFDAVDPAHVVAQHLFKDPPRVTDQRPDLPAAFDRLVLAALVKDPEQRVASAAAFRDLIGAARRALPRAAAQRVLVVDDDPAFAAVVRACIESEIPGVEVETALCGTTALQMVSARAYHVVVTDLDLPDVNGIELTASLRSEDTPPRVLVVTGEGAARDWRVLATLGADGFLLKPLEPTSLVSSVERLLLAQR